MLAVVQMVYPTIKSDARLSLEILYFREIQTRTSPNVWAGVSKRVGGGEVNRKLDDPRPSSKLFALSLGVSFPPFICRTRAYPIRFLFFSSNRIFARLSLDPSHLPPSLPPTPCLSATLLIFASDATLEEMCLYLDSGQIICGNKFLCVQCYVIGFISPTYIPPNPLSAIAVPIDRRQSGHADVPWSFSYSKRERLDHLVKKSKLIRLPTKSST